MCTYMFMYVCMYDYMCVYICVCVCMYVCMYVKFIPQQAEVTQGVPGRLRPRIFLTFGITRVVGLQP